MKAKIKAREKASNVLWDVMKDALFGAIGINHNKTDEKPK